MDIERALKNIGDWISRETESRKYPKSELLELSESLQALNEAIARQSVKSEDVAEAIKWLENERESILHYASLQVLPSGQLKAEESYRLAIAALRQYRKPKLCRLCCDEIDHEDIDLCSACINTLEIYQYQKPTGDTSDGYHTFNELYHHRAILFAALSKAYPDKAWKSLKHHDGTMFDDETFICGIETPKGHYTYHYNTTYWPLFAGKILDNAPEWDGHKPEDVERLMSLQGYQKPTDEAVQNMTQTFESFLSSRHDADWVGDTVSNQYLCDSAQVALRQMAQESVLAILDGED